MIDTTNLNLTCPDCGQDYDRIAELEAHNTAGIEHVAELKNNIKELEAQIEACNYLFKKASVGVDVPARLVELEAQIDTAHDLIDVLYASGCLKAHEEVLVQKWMDIGFSTEPAHKVRAEWAMRWLYNLKGAEQPRIVWKTSLHEITTTIEYSDSFRLSGDSIRSNAGMITSASPFRELERVLEDNVASRIVLASVAGTSFERSGGLYFMGGFSGEFLSGQFLAGTLGFFDYTYAVNAQPLPSSEGERDRELYGLINLALSAGFVYPTEEVCYISARPLSILIDEESRLHGEDVPAVEYADGFKVWAWHGNLVGERIIKRKFSWEEIQKQNNIEIRRSMIDIYGTENFLVDAKAKEIHADGYGTLYWLEQQFDEPLAMVKVINSTPEPDGTYKDYFIRVPPHMATAEQAVAWTFEMSDELYRPEKES